MTGESGARQAAEKWRVHLIVGALALGWTVLYLDRSILFPLLPVIAEEFDLSDTQRGAITSVYFSIYVLMQIPAGVLGDRLGLKNVLTGMYVLIGVGMLGIGVFSASYALLLVFVVVQGFGASAFYSGSYGITISTVPPERRGASSAVVTSGMALGSMLGLGLGGALYDLADSWRVPYLIMLPPTLLVVVVMAVVIKGVPSAPKTQGGFKYLLQNRNMLALGFTSFSALYAYMVISTWGPSFLVEQRGYTLTRAGLYISLVAACSVAGALVWGRLSDRIGRKRLTLAMLTVSAVMVSVATVPQSTAALLASLAAFGFFSSLAWNPIFVAWVGDHTFASGRIGMGTVMGIMNSVGISAAFVAPVVSGWISDTSGSISWAFYVATFVQLAGVVAAVTVKEAGPVRRRAHIAQRSRRADDR